MKVEKEKFVGNDLGTKVTSCGVKWKTMGVSLLEQHPTVSRELAIAAIDEAKVSVVS